MTAQLAIHAELLQCEDGSGFKIQYYLGPHIVPFSDPVPIFDGNIMPKEEHVGFIASRRMEELKAFFDAVHRDVSSSNANVHIQSEILDGEVN